MPNMYTLVAPCFFGTEHTLSFEVKRLGAQNVKVTDGRVAFEGDAAMIAAANLNLRTAERVLLLLQYRVGGTAPRQRRLPGQGLQPVQPAFQRTCLPEHCQKGNR